MKFTSRPRDMDELLTDRARRALDLAVMEAERLGHRYVGTEHLLLGLLAEGGGVAARVLDGLGVDREEARAQVIDVLRGTERPEPRRPAGEVARLRALLREHGINPGP